MLKKVITVVLLLSLIFSVSVMAENEIPKSEEAVPEVSQTMPFEGGEPPQGSSGNMDVPPSGGMQGRTPPDMPNGEMPPGGMQRGQRPQGNFSPVQNQEEFVPQQSEAASAQNNVVNNGEVPAVQTDGALSAENVQSPGGNQQSDSQMSGGMGGFPGNMQNFNGQAQEEQPEGFSGFVKTYSTPITSVVLLGLAFIFVIFYRRKNY